MGMAASQARYLALVARKSNCEYEGQQINQQRLTLSNQSANLFNQMLGLTVPTPPSTSDYTKLQYSYSDGTNASTISSWQQLGTADPDYNYVVTHYYYADQYTGSLKKMSDPQVQFENDATKQTPSSAYNMRTALANVQATQNAYQAALAYVDVTKAAMESAQTTYETAKSQITPTANTYTSASLSGGVYNIDGELYEPYSTYSYVKTQIDALMAMNIISADQVGKDSSGNVDYSNIYVNKGTGTPPSYKFAFKDNLNNCCAHTATSLNTYDLGQYDSSQWTGDICDAENARTNYNNATTDYTNAVLAADAAKLAYDTEVTNFNNTYNSPTYIGNCKLTRLDSLTTDQATELEQVLKDMEKEGVNCNLAKCFTKNLDGTYTYNGGVYSFTMNGTTYYTSIEDLYDSYLSGSGNNNIDGQQKLTYYNSSYISTKIEKTEKALLETDGNGRFTSVRFEDDSVTYTLTTETVTDENAYNDAMNQYNYDNAVYDKTVQDINAKTSLIQQEDQELELRLKQLDTEQNALSQEMEAVQKVVKDNIEKSFSTFKG